MDKKTVAFAVSSLVIGILASALWDIGKPVFFRAGGAFLDVATLGIASLRDAMYIEIARGSYERVSEKVLGAIFGVVLGFGIFAITTDPMVRKSPGNPPSDGLRSRRLRSASLVLLASLLLGLSIQATQVVYINRAANHMEQMLRVVAPFQSERDRLVYISRFAAMTTRQEYVTLISELSDLAKKNNVHVPDFSIY